MGVALAVAGPVAHGAADERGVPGRRRDSPRLVRSGETRPRISRRARRGRPVARLRVQAAQRPARGVAVLADVPARREPRELPSRASDDDAAAAWRENGAIDGYDCVLQNSVEARGQGLAITGGMAAMRHVSRSIVFIFAVTALTMPSWSVRPAAAPAAPTIEQFLMPGYPTEMVSARKIDRIAWTAYEHGRRNVYTASGPQFHALRVTNETKDDGDELGDLNISDDGAIVVFVRGTPPNRDGWVANPTANPDGATRTIWAARTAGGAAWKLGEGTTPALSPDGRTVAYAKDGQIYRYEVRLKPDTTTTTSAVSRPSSTTSSAASKPSSTTTPAAAKPSSVVSGFSRTQIATPWIKAWGSNSNLKWSPD